MHHTDCYCQTLQIGDYTADMVAEPALGQMHLVGSPQARRLSVALDPPSGSRRPHG